MMDLLELNGLGVYQGNQQAPIGTFVDLRVMSVFQQASDGPVPADGKYVLISTNSGLSLSQVATTVNGILGTTYTSGNFHARTGTDAATSQGTGADDA
jgi:hypothetical protein